MNYMEICRAAANSGEADAQAALTGIQEVLAGARDFFTLEYPCHSPHEQRWFFMHVVRPSTEVGGAIIAHTNISERKAAEQALRDLSGQLIQAREEECARIARELHDDFSQRVALVSLELDQLQQKFPDTAAPWRAVVQDVMQQAAELGAEIHRLSRDLHPSKLSHLGLVAAVKSLCLELSRGYDLAIEFTHADVPAGLPKEVSLCLYRIVQESLTNAIKYSGTQEVAVELRGEGEEVWLRVEDEGQGFDVESAQSKKGLGLISMRERLRLVGGTITIDSRIAEGTRIEARVPLGQAVIQPQGRLTADKERASTGD